MKIEGFKEPKSSFLSIEKDLATITDKIMNCDRIKRLLYYTTPDALDKREYPRLSSAPQRESCRPKPYSSVCDNLIHTILTYVFQKGGPERPPSL